MSEGPPFAPRSTQERQSGICPIKCRSTRTTRLKTIAKIQWSQARRERYPLRPLSSRPKINSQSEKGVASRYVHKGCCRHGPPRPSLPCPEACQGFPVSSHVHLERSWAEPLRAAQVLMQLRRSTRHLRNGSKETAKLRRPSESAGLSTSSSSRRPSELTSKI